MTTKPELRIEYVFAKYGRYVIVGLAAGGVGLLLLSGLTFATGPPTTQQQEVADTEEFATNVTTQATVTRDSPLYERNRTLRNQGLYFLGASPTVRLLVDDRSTASGGAEFAHTAAVVLRATEGEEVIWSDRRRLSPASTGGERTVFELNVSRFRNRTIVPVDRQLPDDATLNVRVVLRTSYSSDRYEGEYRTEAPLRVDSRTYRFEGSLDGSERRRSNRSVTRVDQDRTIDLPETGPVPRSSVLSIGLGLALLVGAGVSWRLSRGSRRPDVIRQQLRTAEFNQWISAGHVPEVKPGHVVELSGLKGIVDVAIDADERVIHDESRGEYVVLTEGKTYVYSPGIPTGDDRATRDEPDDDSDE